MKLYMAGMASKKSLSHIYGNGFPKLWSFLNEKRQIMDIPAWTKSDIIVDSGAHSWNKAGLNVIGGSRQQTDLPPVKKYLSDYMDFIYEHRNLGFNFVELDVYSDLPRSYIDDSCREILKIPGNFNFLRVYHKQLDNSSLETLKDWLSEGLDYICLGAGSSELFPKIFNMTKQSIKYHGLAVTSRSMLERYPFYSADSTTWKAPTMYGGYFCPKEFRYISKPSALSAGKKMRLSRLSNDEVDIKSAYAFMKMRDYITDLWAARGVVWND